MALRPAPDLDPRLSARHPLAPRKQRSAAGREPRPRADPPTATYLTRRRAWSEAAAVLGAWLLWTARGASRASPHAGMLSWSAARAPQRAHRQAIWFTIVVSCSERRFSLQHPHHNCNVLCKGLQYQKLLVYCEPERPRCAVVTFAERKRAGVGWQWQSWRTQMRLRRRHRQQR